MADNLIRCNPWPELEVSLGWISLEKGNKIVMDGWGKEEDWNGRIKGKGNEEKGKKGRWRGMAQTKGYFEGCDLMYHTDLYSWIFLANEGGLNGIAK